MNVHEYRYMEEQTVCQLFVSGLYLFVNSMHSTIRTNHNRKAYNYNVNQRLGWCNICHNYNHNE